MWCGPRDGPPAWLPPFLCGVPSSNNPELGIIVKSAFLGEKSPKTRGKPLDRSALDRDRFFKGFCLYAAAEKCVICTTFELDRPFPGPLKFSVLPRECALDRDPALGI